jgi:hypothetical protein
MNNNKFIPFSALDATQIYMKKKPPLNKYTYIKNKENKTSDLFQESDLRKFTRFSSIPDSELFINTRALSTSRANTTGLNPYLTNNDPNFHKNWVPSNEYIFQPLKVTKPYKKLRKKFIDIKPSKPPQNIIKTAPTPQEIRNSRPRNKYLDSLDPIFNHNNLWNFHQNLIEFDKDELNKFKRQKPKDNNRDVNPKKVESERGRSNRRALSECSEKSQ